MFLAIKGFKVYKVFLAIKGSKAYKAYKVFLAIKDSRGFQATKGCKVFLDIKATKVL